MFEVLTFGALEYSRHLIIQDIKIASQSVEEIVRELYQNNKILYYNIKNTA